MKRQHGVYLAGALVTLASLIVWLMTGREGFTRWPDARLEAADSPAPAGEKELLSEAGFADEHPSESRPDIRSRFALGLLPGGADPRHLLAVTSIAAGAAIAVVFTMMWSASRRRSIAALDLPTQGDCR